MLLLFTLLACLDPGTNASPVVLAPEIVQNQVVQIVIDEEPTAISVIASDLDEDELTIDWTDVEAGPLVIAEANDQTVWMRTALVYPGEYDDGEIVEVMVSDGIAPVFVEFELLLPDN